MDYGSRYGTKAGYTSSTYRNDGGCEERFDSSGLDALIAAMRRFDDQYARLRTEGGGVRDVHEITATLTAKLDIHGPYAYNSEARLSDPEKIKAALRQAGHYRVKFSVQRLRHGFPAFYLCRLQRDYWAAYGLVVEDLHRSPGFELADGRFARLMDAGRQRYFLRLADFRDPLRKALNADEEAVDNTLYALGRTIFQGAWHTDQHMAFVLAEHLGLPRLRQAIELTYLSLSCDFGALRRFLSASVRTFFSTCYANEGIVRVLNAIESMNSDTMCMLKSRGEASYRSLSSALNAFLGTPVVWNESFARELPLWKIVYANFDRFALAAKQLNRSSRIQESRAVLEGAAGECMDRLLLDIA